MNSYIIYLTTSCEVARIMASAYRANADVSGKVLRTSYGVAKGREEIPAVYQKEGYFACIIEYEHEAGAADYRLVFA